jgi:hypothetical protein
VVVPETYQELTSRRVLTTGWVEGEKLSQSTADDVGDLVNVGVISYLKQLLDTGFFHVSAIPCHTSSLHVPALEEKLAEHESDRSCTIRAVPLHAEQQLPVVHRWSRC